MRGWARDWLLVLATLLLTVAALLPPVTMERRVFSHLLVRHTPAMGNGIDFGALPHARGWGDL